MNVSAIEPTDKLANFALLENYGGLEKVQEALVNGDPNKALGSYINFIVRYSIGLLSIGAVIMLVYAGIKYITVETFTGKSDSKKIIQRAIGALVLLFSAFIFFDQLNPELLKVRFKPLVTEGAIKESDKRYGNFFDDDDDAVKKYESQGYTDNGSCDYYYLGNSHDGGRVPCNTAREAYFSENKDKEFITKCLDNTDLGPNAFCFYTKNKAQQEVEDADTRFIKDYLKQSTDAQSNGFTLFNSYTGGGNITDSLNKCTEYKEKVNPEDVYKQKCLCRSYEGKAKCDFFIKKYSSYPGKKAIEDGYEAKNSFKSFSECTSSGSSEYPDEDVRCLLYPSTIVREVIYILYVKKSSTQ
jgi:hypothetical protein